MATSAEVRVETLEQPIRKLPMRGRSEARAPDLGLRRWIEVQATNVARHAAALRPFRPNEFGSDAASPSEAHRLKANELIRALRAPLLRASKQMRSLSQQAEKNPTPESLARYATIKDRAHSAVQAAEKVWNFYFELFGQRQSQVADYLLAADRIGLDCYQAVYMGLGSARSIPSPAPFSYMDTGFGPATFRRGVALTALGKRANPFPLVKIPYHRLINPWTLGAVPHEVAHNVQADLGLWPVLPRAILRRMLGAGLSPAIARVWARWHKEMFADVCGLLLIGPAFVESLMGVVGRSPSHTVAFNPTGVHPTPYLRVFINLELLRRMGFERQTADLTRAWNALYPRSLAQAIPAAVTSTFAQARGLAIDVMCFTPYPELGNKKLADVVRFKPKDQEIVEEAAVRLAAGTNPGIIPERFLIAASRVALNRNLARPGTITKNFYQALARR